jgi:hypothetical protein
MPVLLCTTRIGINAQARWHVVSHETKWLIRAEIAASGWRLAGEACVLKNYTNAHRDNLQRP